jgi:hypothetical protein
MEFLHRANRDAEGRSAGIRINEDTFTIQVDGALGALSSFRKDALAKL